MFYLTFRITEQESKEINWKIGYRRMEIKSNNTSPDPYEE